MAPNAASSFTVQDKNKTNAKATNAVLKQPFRNLIMNCQSTKNMNA